jgi:hypothetical protein
MGMGGGCQPLPAVPPTLVPRYSSRTAVCIFRKFLFKQVEVDYEYKGLLLNHTLIALQHE